MDDAHVSPVEHLSLPASQFGGNKEQTQHGAERRLWAKQGWATQEEFDEKHADQPES